MIKKVKRQDLETMVDSYFLYCDAVNEQHDEIVKPYTLSGLISYLEITREEFNKLICNKRYKGVLRFAKAKIEAFIEENALTGELSANASANSLKYNFGWGEKPEKPEKEAGKGLNITLSEELSDLGR